MMPTTFDAPDADDPPRPPPPEGPVIGTWRLRPEARAVAEARHAVAELARRAGWSDDQAWCVLLVVSELTTNAVSRAGTGVALRCRIDHRARVEVTDDDVTALPERRAEDPARIGGLGLRIVEELSEAWGVDVQDDRKTVWAEICPGT